MPTSDRLRAVAIACLVEPGTPGITELIAERGHEEVLARCAAHPRAARAAGRIDPDEVPAMLADMSRRGVRVMLPGDAEFPSQLLDLPEPPLALWINGSLDVRAAALRSVAVVGARACTAYGERATAELAGGLAADGWAVVSGGAFGIDAAAHRAALGVDGATVAVLACGVDVAYPRAHDSLLCRIADAGVVISELPPGSQPLKHRFLARNRVIAALSRGTVVVEAARRSGAMATAARAMEIGRVVMAVPGPITSMASAGTNRLLHEQTARCVADSSEVAALLLGTESAGQPDVRSVERPVDRPTGVPEEAARVLEALSATRACSLESVAGRASVGEAACLAHLGILEVAGLARRTASGWRRSR